jgi:hypothetical protein
MAVGAAVASSEAAASAKTMAGRFAALPAGLIQLFIMSPFEVCE